MSRIALRPPSFGEVVAGHHARGELVVQPRMGFADPALMRRGLLATRDARANTVGTITLDSYTRLGDHDAVRHALAADAASLNGYPLVDSDRATTAAMLDGVVTPWFPVQVRHGSAEPGRIVRTMLDFGLYATEGGPVSYCLPYGRTPLAVSVDNWRRACEALAAARAPGREPHLETFGGCMMGQLCPPALLLAISVLEGMFFRQHGLRCISFSYAQQTHAGQDEEAVAALHELIRRYVPDARTHVVIYTYMGVYPRTPGGARRLLAESARLAARSGASRLIVKTAAEAHQLPTIAENVAALEYAALEYNTAGRAETAPHRTSPIADTGILAQATALVENVLDLGSAGRTRARLDRDGRLEWARIGSLPIGNLVEPRPAQPLTADALLSALRFVEHRFDQVQDHEHEHSLSHHSPHLISGRST
jgi:methylaspartate mutase epsilon subunit